MQKFIVQGRRHLAGGISVSGSKNAVLKLLPACVLVPGSVQLNNVPKIEAVDVMVALLQAIGAKIDRSADGHTLAVDARKIHTAELPAKLVTRERATSVLVGPLLARFGDVSFPHPGGDVIGERPLDALLGGLRALGATVEEGDRYYRVKAKRLLGTRYVFRWVSVTVTENLMLAATLAEGVTELVNAALEPEVVELAEFLNHCGAQIEGAGTPTIRVKGVKALRANNASVNVMPDRIETATFACLAAATNSKITISHCEPLHVEVLLRVLDDVGVKTERTANSITVLPHTGKLRATEIRTHEYPGFATDYQSPMTVLLTQATGVSLVHETVFEGRLFYTDKLKQMGAKIIMADPHRVIVVGPANLRGRKIISPDIRAGMALVIAGLVAEGTTTIGNIYQIDRGYENIDVRLSALGAEIKRVETDSF